MLGESPPVWAAWSPDSKSSRVCGERREAGHVRVTPEPLGPEPEPEPTQEIVDLSGEATGAESDLMGPAAVPDDIVPETVLADLDLTETPSEGQPQDPMITTEHLDVTIEALKALKVRVVVRVKKLGIATRAAIALCVLAVAAVLLIHFAADYTGEILLGCGLLALLLILLAWSGGRNGRDD